MGRNRLARAALGVRTPRLRPADLLLEAFVSVTRHPSRSLMTALGTILGGSAFVATLGLTSTLERQVSGSFDIRRSTEVIVRAEDRSLDPAWQNGVALSRLRSLNGVVHAGGRVLLDEVEVRRTPSFAGGAESLRLMGADAEALRVMAPRLVSGRLFDDIHDVRRAKVVLLPESTARRLGIIKVGVAVFVADQAYTVIGIFDDVARRPEALLAAVVPFGTADPIAAGTVNAERDVVIETAAGAAQLIGAQASLALRPEAPEALAAIAPPDPRTLRQEIEGSVTRLSLLLSAVALAIGAVSIANAATANVASRIPEIGIRRAVGARPAHIFGQLVAETAVLGCVGATVGAFLGIVITAVVSLWNGWVPILDLQAAAAASGMGAAAGLAAGLLPAIRATRVQPVVALQR